MRFSALQRAEIAEMLHDVVDLEPFDRFSALQRAEIAEMSLNAKGSYPKIVFQCSSTSRNC